MKVEDTKEKRKKGRKRGGKGGRFKREVSRGPHAK
jgi:hypothetical protein